MCFSQRGPHALDVARLDDLEKQGVVGLHRAQMLEQPRERQSSREIDRERIGFASGKDEERSLRNHASDCRDESARANQATSSWPGWPVFRGTGPTLQLRSAVPFVSLRPDANDIPA
jgi:hypothetical protein